MPQITRSRRSRSPAAATTPLAGMPVPALLRSRVQAAGTRFLLPSGNTRTATATPAQPQTVPDRQIQAMQRMPRPYHPHRLRSRASRRRSASCAAGHRRPPRVTRTLRPPNLATIGYTGFGASGQTWAVRRLRRWSRSYTCYRASAHRSTGPEAGDDGEPAGSGRVPAGGDGRSGGRVGHRSGGITRARDRRAKRSRACRQILRAAAGRRDLATTGSTPNSRTPPPGVYPDHSATS